MERTCIVTREAQPPERLIRFVLSPDGEVVADFRRRLPGRGAWVSAERTHIETAERKKLFSRAFGQAVTVAPDLAGRVEAALLGSAAEALSLARKAGTVVAGYAKVDAALSRDPVVALIVTKGAGNDGVAKIAAAARRRFGPGKEPPTIRCFGPEQIDLAFGRTNVIHAALLAGPASDNVLARVRALARFDGAEAISDAAGQPLPYPIEASAGS